MIGLARAALAAFSLTAMIFAVGSAHAEVIGTFSAWTALVQKETGGQVCFAVTAPKKSEGDYAKRGDIFLLVTHRPHEKSFGVVNIQAGYAYKARSEAVARIGPKTYRLFTDGENAWARDDGADRELVAAMKSGNTFVVTGSSSRETKTTDTFSLSGFTAAYSAASKACGVKP